MKKTLAKALTIVGLAGAAIITPTAATAYAPEPSPDTVVVQIGAPITVVFDPVFTPGETVNLTLTGINGSSQSIASVADVSSATAVTAADAAGSADATVTLNETASGSYTVTAAGAVSGASDTVTLSVASPAGGAAPTEAGLPPTGLDSAALGLWVGGGALLLGGGAVLVSRSVRKQRTEA